MILTSPEQSSAEIRFAIQTVEQSMRSGLRHMHAQPAGSPLYPDGFVAPDHRDPLLEQARAHLVIAEAREAEDLPVEQE